MFRRCCEYQTTRHYDTASDSTRSTFDSCQQFYNWSQKSVVDDDDYFEGQ